MLMGPNDISEKNYTKYTYNFRNDLRVTCESLIPRFGVKNLSDVLTIIIMDYLGQLKDIETDPKPQMKEVIVIQQTPRLPKRSHFDPRDWWRKKIKETVDLPKETQYTLDISK